MSPQQQQILQAVYEHEQAVGGALPFGSLYTTHEEAGLVYIRCRQLEDYGLLHFGYWHVEGAEHDNQRQFVFLSQRGRDALLAALLEQNPEEQVAG